jgi:hypothetical protein
MANNISSDRFSPIDSGVNRDYILESIKRINNELTLSYRKIGKYSLSIKNTDIEKAWSSCEMCAYYAIN